MEIGSPSKKMQGVAVMNSAMKHRDRVRAMQYYRILLYCIIAGPDHTTRFEGRISRRLRDVSRKLRRELAVLPSGWYVSGAGLVIAIEVIWSCGWALLSLLFAMIVRYLIRWCLQRRYHRRTYRHLLQHDAAITKAAQDLTGTLSKRACQTLIVNMNIWLEQSLVGTYRTRTPILPFKTTYPRYVLGLYICTFWELCRDDTDRRRVHQLLVTHRFQHLLILEAPSNVLLPYIEKEMVSIVQQYVGLPDRECILRRILNDSNEFESSGSPELVRRI